MSAIEDLKPGTMIYFVEGVGRSNNGFMWIYETAQGVTSSSPGFLPVRDIKIPLGEPLMVLEVKEEPLSLTQSLYADSQFFFKFLWGEKVVWWTTHGFYMTRFLSEIRLVVVAEEGTQ